MYCTKCGKQSMDYVGSFCAYCGSPMVSNAVPDAQPAKSGPRNDLPAGVLWPLILLCARCVMWAIASVMFFAARPGISTWNIVWTIFGFYTVYRVYKRSYGWYKTTLYLTGIDAVWLLIQYFGYHVHQLFFFIAAVNIIAFVLLLVNRQYFK